MHADAAVPTTCRLFAGKATAQVRCVICKTGQNKRRHVTKRGARAAACACSIGAAPAPPSRRRPTAQQAGSAPEAPCTQSASEVGVERGGRPREEASTHTQSMLALLEAVMRRGSQAAMRQAGWLSVATLDMLAP
eukprot:364268-Chlamydomonas_euryale.AAC.5